MVLNIPPKTSNVLEIFPPWLPKGGLACFQRVNDEAILVGGPKMPLYVYSKCAGLDSCWEGVLVDAHAANGGYADLGVQIGVIFILLQ